MEAFLRELEAIPWFASIGEPLPAGSGCKQIGSWDEWRGPEEPSVAEVADRQQTLYDEMMGGREAPRLKDLWDRVHEVVFREATPGIPYDPDADTWHPPTFAVWHAAWTAGLVGAHRFLHRPIPPELHQQWHWFAAGHWPCDWEGDLPEGKPVVY